MAEANEEYARAVRRASKYRDTFLIPRNLQIIGALHKQLRDMLDIMLAEHDMLQYVSK
jgi:hypothetical protein